MKVIDLLNLQGTLFVMILTGVVLKRRGTIDEPGKKCLTDLCVGAITPCNIIKSYLIAFDISALEVCSVLLAVDILIQLSCVFLNRSLFNGYYEQRKKVLQYCTIASSGGSLRNPIAGGVYGGLGLLYASVLLTPMRVVMWLAGTSYLIAGLTDPKKVIRNILTHPCLVAIYIEMFLIVTQIQSPVLLVPSIQTIGNYNSATTMLITGTILADVNIKTTVNKITPWFSVFRLILLSLIASGPGLLFGLDPTATGVGVIMTGMPAGVTAAISAARYNSDVPSATKCVVLTMLLSMVTIPI